MNVQMNGDILDLHNTNGKEAPSTLMCWFEEQVATLQTNLSTKTKESDGLFYQEFFNHDKGRMGNQELHGFNNFDFETIWKDIQNRTFEKKGLDNIVGAGDNVKKDPYADIFCNPSLNRHLQSIIGKMVQEATNDMKDQLQREISMKTAPLKKVMDLLEYFSSNNNLLERDGDSLPQYSEEIKESSDENQAKSNFLKFSSVNHSNLNFYLPNYIQEVLFTSKALEGFASSTLCNAEPKQKMDVDHHVSNILRQDNTLPEPIKYCYDIVSVNREPSEKGTLISGIKALEFFSSVSESGLYESDCDDGCTETDEQELQISCMNDFSKFLYIIFKSFNRISELEINNIPEISKENHQSQPDSDSTTASFNEKQEIKCDPPNIDPSCHMSPLFLSPEPCPLTPTLVLEAPLRAPVSKTPVMRTLFETIKEEGNEKIVSFESVAIVGQNKESNRKSNDSLEHKSSLVNSPIDSISLVPKGETLVHGGASQENRCNKGFSTAENGVSSELLTVCKENSIQISGSMVGASADQGSETTSTAAAHIVRKSSLVSRKIAGVRPKKRVSLVLDKSASDVAETTDACAARKKVLMSHRYKCCGISSIHSVDHQTFKKRGRFIGRLFSRFIGKRSNEDVIADLNNIYTALYTDEVTPAVSKSVSVISKRINSSNKSEKNAIISAWIEMCDRNFSLTKDKQETPSFLENVRSRLFSFGKTSKTAECKKTKSVGLSSPAEEKALIKEMIIKKFAREIIGYLADDPKANKLKRKNYIKNPFYRRCSCSI